MIVNVHLRHITHSEGIEQQIAEMMGEVLDKVSQRFSRFRVEVFVSKVKPRTEVHGATYECHITGDISGYQQTLFVKTKDQDFWKCLRRGATKLKQQVTRKSAIQADGVDYEPKMQSISS